ncbi:MAG: thioredoxin family protein [bacterium]
MVETRSAMAPLGMSAPQFSLADTQGNLVSLRDFEGAPALLVMFLCNHCPFVKNLQMDLAGLVQEYQEMGLVAVAINSNDFTQYPDDNPDRMAEEVNKAGYTFPYLIDEDQSVAKEYRAACTPDFFLFDNKQELFYRGQFDNSRPSNDVAITGVDLGRAIKLALQGEEFCGVQKPSIGCNIKWKSGNQPDYF